MKKKLICLLLCSVMTIAIFTGCSDAGGFRVGYGRVDVTPTESVPLAGMGSSWEPRRSDEVLNKLYVTCIAFTDEADKTVLMYHMDILNTYDSIYAWIPDIAQATEVPEGNIILAATHNHSGPSINNKEVEYMSEYRAMFKQALIDAGLAALKDRKTAEMHITSSNPVNLNFVRHYVRADGTVHGEGGNADEAHKYIGHTVDVDDQLQLIKFTRKGGKDVLLMNFQGHPMGHAEYRYAILSDVDVIRQKVEAELDCQFAYFLGASGNVNSTSPIPEEQRTTDYVSHGNAVAQEAITAAANFTKVNLGNIQLLTEEVLASRKDGGGSLIPATVFSIGDVAFLSAGFEMFCESGQAIKEASPFKMTFVATCSNGDFKYMPTLATYKYVAYETGTATWHVKGTAEELEETYKTLLNELKTLQ